MSSSYPYLTISRLFDVPYGAVLQYVSKLDGTFQAGRAQDVIEYLDWERMPDWVIAADQTFRVERARQRQEQLL